MSEQCHWAIPFHNGDVRKVAVARRLRTETTVLLKWITTHLHLGTWTHVANRLATAISPPTNQTELTLCQKQGATPLRQRIPHLPRLYLRLDARKEAL